MTERFDDEVWTGVERRMATVESLIPEPPPWQPAHAPTARPAVSVARGPAFGMSSEPRRRGRPLIWTVVVLSLIVIVLVGALYAAGAIHGPFVPRPLGRNGLIAYSEASANGTSGIAVVAPDGGGRRTLIGPTSEYGGCPLFSPDGTQIAYLGPGDHVTIAAADGSNSHLLSQMVAFPGGASRTVEWAPDGTRVAFVPTVATAVDVAPANAVEVVTLSDGSSTLIRAPAVDDVVDVAWSPDGRRIALVTKGGSPGFNPDRAAIFVVDTDGSHLRQLTVIHTGLNPPMHLSWSPDGTQIAYVAWDGGLVLTSDVFVVRVDGRGETKLTHSSLDEYAATWAPDGRRIAFATEDGTVTTVSPDGSDPLVVDKGAFAHGLVWSPDARRVLVTLRADRPGHRAPMRSVSADGTGSTIEYDPDGGSCPPSWQRLDP